MALIFLLAGIAAAIATVIALNLTSGEKKIVERIEPRYSVSDPQFLRSMGSLLGPAVRGGNRVTALENGDEIFPSMLEAIRSAQRTITFETYIYGSGSIGKEFADALSERAEEREDRRLLLCPGRPFGRDPRGGARARRGGKRSWSTQQGCCDPNSEPIL
ncbi:MAG TPA: hypothetical protein VF139_12325 [Candidatus Polarisedimenticolaceae bacterium]